MDKTLALVFALGAVLIAIGLTVLIASTDFDPNPFMENRTNQTGQLAGVVLASGGVVVVAIGAASLAVCRALVQREAA